MATLARTRRDRLAVIRFAVVGLGEHSCTRLLPALARLADAEVGLGVDPDPGARARATKALPSLQTSAAFDDVLDGSAVDAVVVAAPPAVAAELAEAARGRGLPVYLEKPGATVRADLAALDTAGPPVMTGFCYRFEPAIQELHRQVRGGAIGTVRAARFAFSGANTADGWKADPRLGGGALRDLGVHHVDLARVLLGDEIHEVAALLTSRRTADDTATVIATTRAGVTVDLFAAQGASDRATLELVGDDGILSVDQWSAPWVDQRPREARGPLHAWLGSTRHAVSGHGLRAARAAGRAGAPQERALAQFLTLVRGDAAVHDVDVPGVRDLSAALSVIEAAERAASDGQRVAVG